MHARLRGPKTLLTLYQIINKLDFLSLADEIAEPRPDMNIKVAAFTVSKKLSNTYCTGEPLRLRQSLRKSLHNLCKS